MPASKSIVETTNGSRYLQQLCKHWAHRFAVEYSPESGMISFDDGRECKLSATSDKLEITASVPDGADLERFQSVVAEHVARFAFRETLSFEWRPVA